MEIWEIGIELIKNMIDMNIININRIGIEQIEIW